MWFFDWIGSGCGYIADYCSTLAGRIEAVPLLGSYISYPVRVIAWAAGWMKTAAYAASTWADGIAGQIGSVLQQAWGFAQDVLGQARQLVDQVRNTAWGWFQQVPGLVNAGIFGALPAVWGSISSLWSAVTDARAEVWSGQWISSLIGPITQGVAAEASRVFPSLEGAVITLIDQGLGLVKRQVARWSRPLWDLLEEVLRHLPGPEG